ncbi:MAG: hypothetical protein NTU73_09990 [Ignavibacteriae bacterium]|nr:hypothetical protein [Ignavibacteriota bacterium]
MKEITEKFIGKLDSKEESTNTLEKVDLRKVIKKQVPFSVLQEKMKNARVEDVIIKEVFCENEVEIIGTVKNMKSTYKQEVDSAIERVSDLYNSEHEKLEKAYREKIFGKQLFNIINAIADIGWIIIVKKTGLFFYKCFYPNIEISIGRYDDGKVREYDEPFCYLKGIYINALHQKITYGTIHISSENQHPNVEKVGFGQACVGTLDGRKIILDDTKKLKLLLKEVEELYKVAHLTSSHYTPEGNYETLKQKEGTWNSK